MYAVVVYESMYGNTHALAEAIAEGLSEHASVDVLSTRDIRTGQLRSADLGVFGAPTHQHGLPTESSRRQAAHWARRHSDLLFVDDPKATFGLRELLIGPADLPRRAAAFGTRTDIAPVLGGDASLDLDRLLMHRGVARIASPEGFLVSPTHCLINGERGRARAWGERLGAQVTRIVALDELFTLDRLVGREARRGDTALTTS